jgi:hypothetical protein
MRNLLNRINRIYKFYSSMFDTKIPITPSLLPQGARELSHSWIGGMVGDPTPLVSLWLMRVYPVNPVKMKISKYERKAFCCS